MFSRNCMLVIVGIATLLVCSPSLAGSKEEAKIHYDRAVSLVDDGQLENALVEFQRAYDLTKHYQVLFNIAQISAALAKPIEAIKSYEAYLSEGGQSVSAKNRGEVIKELAKQRSRVATLKFKITPVGARVRVDGGEIGNVPALTSWQVSMGEHTVLVEADGRESESLKVMLAGLEVKEIKLDLRPKSSFEKATVLAPGKANPSNRELFGKPVANAGLPGESQRPVQSQIVDRPIVTATTPPPYRGTWSQNEVNSRYSPAQSNLVAKTDSLPPTKPQRNTLTQKQVVGIWLSGIGAVSLGTAAICLLVSNSRYDKGLAIWNQRNDDKLALKYRSQAKDYMFAGKVTAVLGGGLLVVGGALYIWGVESSPELANKSSARKNSMRFAPFVSPSYVGFDMRRTW